MFDHRARGTCPRSPTPTTACRSCRRSRAAATTRSPGPDNWVVFDNGPARVDAAWKLPAVPDVARPGAVRLARTPATCRRGRPSPACRRSRRSPRRSRASTCSRQPRQREEGAAVDRAVPADLHRARPGDRDGVARQGGARRRSNQAAEQAERVPGHPGDSHEERRKHGGVNVAPVLRSDHVAGWAFACPAVALIVAFGVVPIVWSFAAVVPEDEPARHAGVGRARQLPGALEGPAVQDVGRPHRDLHGAVRAAVGGRCAARSRSR